MSEGQPTQPAQEQGRQPGLEAEMTPRPAATRPQYRGSGKLHRKASLITGGDSGIGTTSITAYQGNPVLLDYSATKGAIVAFTRALSQQLIGKKGIRVNAVAPGPVWTPLIPASFPAEQVEKFGRNTPMGRPAQPEEIAPCYVFLASDDATFMAGQVLHPNGGQVVNG